MKIPNNIHHQWLLLRKHRDIADICKESGIARNKISLAVNYGIGEEREISACQKFYEARKSKQRDIENANSPY